VIPFTEKLRYMIAIKIAPPASIGEELKLARLKAGWTGRELAEFLGTNEMTICNWERGGVIYKLEHRAKVDLFLGKY
jgi:transcriptional regulator with XRE-family HTH domain